MTQPLFPKGQGIWIWQLGRCCGGDMERLIDECCLKNFSHVLIKCVDGARRFSRNAELDRYVIDRLRACGITVAGWGFHYGERPEAEAAVAASVCTELNHEIYICNAEAEWKCPEGALRAERFVKEFRFRSQAGARLGLSTFALPSLHPDFPYQAFLSGCDFIMPQIYTVPSRRWAFLRELHGYATEAVDQLNRYGRPVIPTLRAYTGDGLYDWRRIVEDARAFLATPLAQSLPAFNWWVWQSAERNVDMWRLLSATAQAVVQGEE